MGIESIIIWVLLGAVSGWLAGQISKGHGFGLVGNIIVGILGSFLGGWLGGQLGITSATGGFSILSIVTAVVGALILLFLIGLVKRK